MSDSARPLPSDLPPTAHTAPALSSMAATSAGQRVQTLGNRAWRAFGTTPWWRLVAGGMIVIIGVLLLAVPFDSIRIANRIESQAAKDALRNALQQEVLERARGGLILVRSFAVGEEQVAEIDAAIVDLERELAKPIATERFDGTFAELVKNIDSQRAKRDDALKRLSETASKLASAKDPQRTALAEKIRELSDEIDSQSEALAALEEQRAAMDVERADASARREAERADASARREAERADADARRESERADVAARREAERADADSRRAKGLPKDAPAPPAPPQTPNLPAVAPPASKGSTAETKSSSVTRNAETTVKFDALGLKGTAIIDLDRARAPLTLGFQANEPSAALIRETISRDVRKAIVAGIATAVLITLFLFMLIARSFAGRTARGEQRAVIAESRERTESHARQLAEARLTLMRAQVEPHFLFNTLAHVQALQEIDPPQASTMLERLISYLRAAMPSMRETKSTLGREIDVVRAYLDLLKIRMGDRMKYFINVPAEMNGVALPPTMIATLVENAIKHGLEPKKEGGSIAVQVRKLEASATQGERLEILVADDGLGFGAAETGGTGIGLANTRERLKMLYGSQAELVVEPNAPSGVRAMIRVPLQMPETVDDVDDEIAVDAMGNPIGSASDDAISPFTIKSVILLALCFGWLGVHRLYVGSLRTGLTQAVLGVLSILTGGLVLFLVPLVVWVILDVVWIGTREFRDGQGFRIARLRASDTEAALSGASGGSSAHVSPYTIQVMALLTLCFGALGVHRFYIGRYRTGVLQAGLLFLSIVTGGLPIFLLPLVMWVVLDLAWILSRDFRDAKGRRIMRRDSRDGRNYSAKQLQNKRQDPSVSQASRGIALLLAIALGWCGAHRFYVGRVGTALVMLATLGGLGIWWLVDIVMVACGQLKDMDGKWVSEWE